MTSAYISRDSVSLESGLHSLLATGSHSLPVDDYTSVEAENPSGPPETAGQEELPRKKVGIVLSRTGPDLYDQTFYHRP